MRQVPLLFDATRLCSRSGLSAPTGIDRVDCIYAQALHSDEAVNARLMRFDFFGAQELSAGTARRLLKFKTQAVGSTTVEVDLSFDQLVAWLQAGSVIAAPRWHHPGRSTEPVSSQAVAAFAHFCGASRLRATLASNSQPIYLNSSHGRLYQPTVASWLDRIQPLAVFFVHDLIPIDYPEYNRPTEPARHAARLAVIARHARAVIVNSAVTRDSLLRYWDALDTLAPPVTVLPLGVDAVFTPDGPRVEAHRPYFVVVGTLEPRKNHMLLLDVWERLIKRCGAQAPKLVLVGRRGWENQSLFKRLDDSRPFAGRNLAASLRSHVAEVSGMRDDEVAQLLRGARGLLMPSQAEGYGLPVAEALACGTPVLASDLPAHREVAGGFGRYLKVDDAALWSLAVESLTQASPEAARRIAGVDNYRAPRWCEHLQGLYAVLAEVARSG